MRCGSATTNRVRHARTVQAPASGPGEPAKRPVRWSSAWVEARSLVWSRRWRLALGLVLMLVNRLSGLVLPWATTREYQALGYGDVSDWISNAEAGLRTDSAKEIAGQCIKTEPKEWWEGLKA